MPVKHVTVMPVEDRRESSLQEQALVDEMAVEALIREAEHVVETSVQPQPQAKPTYPAWPTSTPGPQVTTPPVGMKPVRKRSDQMVYECYDQEQGIPCTPRPRKRFIQPIYQHPVMEQVKVGQEVYDVQGSRVGMVLVRFPRHLLVERGLIFRRSYYIPTGLVRRVEGQRVMLAESEATLIARGYSDTPAELYHMAQPSGGIVYPDISGASRLGKFPPTPAETGHYHYGPYSPGINTDAGGSYAPHEIDPYGRGKRRSTTLYVSGEGIRPRTL